MPVGPGVEPEEGAPAGREVPETFGVFGGRPPGGVDDGRLDGEEPEEPETFGVLGPRDPPGADDRDGVDPPEDDEDDVGDELPDPLLTFGPDLPRPAPD